MKKRITGKLDRISRDFDGNGIVSFAIPGFRQIEPLKELDPEKLYDIEIKEIRSQRTARQNRYLWELIHEIDIAVNGRPSRDGMDDIYLELLDRAGAKVDFLYVDPKAEAILKSAFRVVRPLTDVEIDGKAFTLYRVVSGSSKMTTKEMKTLIDTVLDYAEEVGIESDYWKEMLK